jgi:Zn-dependent membrane protease YugP
MFERRSKAAFLAAVLGTAYAIYAILYVTGVTGDAVSGDDAGEAIAGAIFGLLAFPHMIVTAIGAIFALVGFFARKSGLILTGAILFSVAALLLIVWAPFLIPSIILGFIGYSKQKKLNNPAAA